MDWWIWILVGLGLLAFEVIVPGGIILLFYGRTLVDSRELHTGMSSSDNADRRRAPSARGPAAGDLRTPQ